MTTELRVRAIGMLDGCLTQKDVAKWLEKGIRTIKRWWRTHINNEILHHRPGAVRPPNSESCRQDDH